jgi:hypothetical protein
VDDQEKSMNRSDYEREQADGFVAFMFLWLVVFLAGLAWCLERHPKPTLIVAALLLVFGVGVHQYDEHQRGIAREKAAAHRQFMASQAPPAAPAVEVKNPEKPAAKVMVTPTGDGRFKVENW